MNQTINERVVKTITEELGVLPDEVVSNAKVMDDLGADSLDLVELVMALEEEFGIDISEEDTARITDVKSIVAYIEERTQ